MPLTPTPICKYCKKLLNDHIIRGNSNEYCSVRCLTAHVKLQKNIDEWLSTKMVVKPIDFEELVPLEAVDWRD